MDANIRNFKDFLQLYNKITEICFSQCVDNFFNRNVSPNEGSCADNCVLKFAQYNRRLMNVYVEVQTAINARRMAELEQQIEHPSDTNEQKLQPPSSLTQS